MRTYKVYIDGWDGWNARFTDGEGRTWRKTAQTGAELRAYFARIIGCYRDEIEFVRC